MNAREITTKLTRMLDEPRLLAPPVDVGEGLLVLVAPTDDNAEVGDP
jgi:hypothetical protein